MGGALSRAPAFCSRQRKSASRCSWRAPACPRRLRPPLLANRAATPLPNTAQEPMPVDQLVRSLCDTKQGYTQFGGLRPFGVSLLYAGW